MNYFSMFIGIGGFEYGIEQAIGTWNCVGYSEIDRYAAAITRYHYPKLTNYGDATRIQPETLPSCDLIVGGFPCQSFSIAGKRRGFEDTRGTLFFEICRIARAKRVSYLWLENVKGLLSHDEGRTFQTIIESLDELGYDCQWQVLNSKYHGVPQNRERVFIIGHLRGQSRPKVFPITETSIDDGRITEESREKWKRLSFSAITSRAGSRIDDNFISHTIDANYWEGTTAKDILDHKRRTMVFLGGISGENKKKWLDDGNERSRNYPQGQRVYSTEGISAQINAQGGGWGAKTGLYQIPQTAQALQTDGFLRSGTSFGTDNPQSSRNIRRLTPKECERLQGFPDEWTKYGLFDDGEKLISDTQRYKCLGNAVTTNVITEIARRWVANIDKQVSM